jgi:hypothetical protein
MSSPAPTLADILNAVMGTVQTILYNIATAISQNASVIATVVVLGGLAFIIMRYGRNLFTGLSSWFKGLF